VILGEWSVMNYKRLLNDNRSKKRKSGERVGRRLFIAGVSFLVILSGFYLKNELPEKGAAKENVKGKRLSYAEQTDGWMVQVPNPSDNSKKALDYYKKHYQKKKATTVVSVSNVSKKQLKRMFYQTKISDTVFQRMYKNSYKKNCTVPKSDLRYIRVLYYGFDKKTHIGELVVNRRIAKDICNIFYRLYCKKYPIEKMVLVDEYNAVDEDSMADNNTSSFNYRRVSGTAHLSKHSYGMAVDINPLYNPYIHTINGKKVCEPVMGRKYLNRSKSFAYKIDKKDLCYKLFVKYGFTWGGSWKSVKDYQHFEKAL